MKFVNSPDPDPSSGPDPLNTSPEITREDVMALAKQANLPPGEKAMLQEAIHVLSPSELKDIHEELTLRIRLLQLDKPAE